IADEEARVVIDEVAGDDVGIAEFTGLAGEAFGDGLALRRAGFGGGFFRAARDFFEPAADLGEAVLPLLGFLDVVLERLLIRRRGRRGGGAADEDAANLALLAGDG